MDKSLRKGAVVVFGCLLFLNTAHLLAARAQSAQGDVVDEMNFARQQPGAYAQSLIGDAKALRIAAAQDDDAGAFDEAVVFLKRQPPLPPLRSDEALARAALAHAEFQGPEGSIGHGGPNDESFDERLHRYGVWAGAMAENISYGFRDPREVVRQLIVDSGVPDRGHRENIFNPEFRVAGAACAPHKVYGSMCVIDFIDAPLRR